MAFGVLNRFVAIAAATLCGCSAAGVPLAAPGAAAQSVQSPFVEVIREQLEVPKPDGLTALATGFFVSPDGYLLANAHAVADCRQVRVSGPAIEDERASLLVLDTRIDAALLKIDAPPPAFLRIARGRPSGGDVAAVLAYPGIRKATEGATVTSTRFVGDRLGAPGFMDVAAALEPGQSGGPLIDANGYVSGMVAGRVSGLEQSSIAVAGRALGGLLDYADVKRKSRDPLGGVPGAEGRRITADVLDAMSAAVVRLSCL